MLILSVFLYIGYYMSLFSLCFVRLHEAQSQLTPFIPFVQQSQLKNDLVRLQDDMPAQSGRQPKRSSSGFLQEIGTWVPNHNPYVISSLDTRHSKEPESVVQSSSNARVKDTHHTLTYHIGSDEAVVTSAGQKYGLCPCALQITC